MTWPLTRHFIIIRNSSASAYQLPKAAICWLGYIIRGSRVHWAQYGKMAEPAYPYTFWTSQYIGIPMHGVAAVLKYCEISPSRRTMVNYSSNNIHQKEKKKTSINKIRMGLGFMGWSQPPSKLFFFFFFLVPFWSRGCSRVFRTCI